MVQLPYSTWSALQAVQIATMGSRLPVSNVRMVCKQSPCDAKCNHTLNRPQAEVHRMQHSGCSKERTLGTDYAVKMFVKKSQKNISTHYSIQGTKIKIIRHVPPFKRSRNSKTVHCTVYRRRAVLSIERAPFYRMALFLGIPRPCSTFYRTCKFLERAEHIQYNNYDNNSIIMYIILQTQADRNARLVASC